MSDKLLTSTTEYLAVCWLEHRNPSAIGTRRLNRYVFLMLCKVVRLSISIRSNVDDSPVLWNHLREVLVRLNESEKSAPLVRYWAVFALSPREYSLLLFLWNQLE